MATVLHLITGLGLGGAERQLTALATARPGGALRHVVVAMTDELALAPAIEQAGVTLHRLGMRRGALDPGAMLRLVGLIRREKPDVLQSWLYHADLMGLVAGKLARVARIAWNLRCSNMDAARYARLTRLTAGLSRFPDAVAVNSAAGQRFHEGLGYRPKRWAMIPNGIDTDRFRPDAEAGVRLRQELGIGAALKIVGHVARFDAMKDHATLIKAAAELPDTCLVLVGAGVAEGLATSGLSLPPDRIRVLGARGDVDRLMPGFDALASSSAYGEGFPNVIGEAMASGVAVAATDVGDSAAVIGDLGAVVLPGDPAQLADALRRVLAAPPAPATLAARIAEHYSTTRMVDRYEDFYAGLISTRT